VVGSVAAGATFSYPFNNVSGQPVRVTLVWNDPASGTTNGGTLNPAGASYLVNDLDLRVDGPSTTFLPWVLDPANPANAATTGDNGRDNVEQVFVMSPAAGSYTIRVVAPAALTSGPQQFSLVFSGADATADNATYSALTITDDRTYAVRQDLTFGPAFVVTGPGDVNGYGGRSVTLMPGFHAQAGSRFLGRILPGGGCGIFSGRLKADNYPATASAGAIEAFTERQLPVNESGQPDAGVDFQVMPNPATDAFSVRFDVEERTPVSLQLSDATGKLVQQWGVREMFDAGSHRVESGNLNLMPGIYYVELQTPSARRVQKLVILGQ
jgi:hypothetical protein